MLIFLLMYNIMLYSQSASKLDILIDYYQKAKYEAVTNFGEIFYSQDKNIEILKILAKSYLKSKNYVKAINSSNEILLQNSSWYEAYKIISYSYFKQNDFKNALDYLKAWELKNSNKTIEELFYLTEIYSRNNLDASPYHKEIIKTIEANNLEQDFFDIYINSLEYLKFYKKEIKLLESKASNCEDYIKLQKLYSNLNIVTDTSFTKTLIKLCKKPEDKYLINNSSNVSTMYLDGLNLLKLEASTSAVHKSNKYYIAYAYNDYSNSYNNKFHNVNLAYSFFKNDLEAGFGINPLIGIDNNKVPFNFVFSNKFFNNSILVSYENNNPFFKNLDFAQNNIFASSLFLEDSYNLKNINFNLKFNYNELSSSDYEYVNLFNTSLKISSKITQDNPFLIGIIFHSMNFSSKDSSFNYLSKDRFMLNLFWEFETSNELGLNLKTNITMGSDLENHLGFSEIMNIFVNSSYSFSNSLKLNLNIAYNTVIESAVLEKEFTTSLGCTLNY